jgi:hypothetical protein
MSNDEYEIDEEGNIFRPDYPRGTVEVMEEPFEADLNMAREHGYGLPKPTPYNEWIQLSRGKTIGKRGNLNIGVDGQLSDTINLLEVGGPDMAAINLCVTLIPPQRIYDSVTAIANAGALNATGSQDINDPLEPVPPGTFPGSFIDVFAILEWGIGGIQSSAEVDFVMGTQINIQASWVRLRASGRIVSGTNELISVGAFVGPGQASNQAPAQRTIWPRLVATPDVYDIGALAPGTKTSFMPVPNFAKKVRAIANIQFGGAFPAVVPHLALEMHMDADPATPDGLLNWDLEGFDLYNQQYPVPSAIHFMKLHNHGAVAVAAAGLIFELNL